MNSKTLAGGLLAVLGGAVLATDAEAGGGSRQTAASTATSPASSSSDSTSPPSAGTVDTSNRSLQERVNYFYSNAKTWRDPSTSFRSLADNHGAQAVVNAVRDARGADYGDVAWVAQRLGISL